MNREQYSCMGVRIHHCYPGLNQDTPLHRSLQVGRPDPILVFQGVRYHTESVGIVLYGPGQSSTRALSDAGVNMEGPSRITVNCQMGERCKYFQVPRFLGGLGVESLSVAPSVVTQLLQVYNRERRRCTLYPLYFIMSTNYGLTVTDTQVPNRVQLCGTSQYNVNPVDMGQRRILIFR
jgi:hypothetical protein